MVVVGPSGSDAIGALHGSAFVLGTAVGCRVGMDEVGRGSRVGGGGRVGTGVSVGGMGVAVGMAACVSATMVEAAAKAVDCTSAGFMVGVACGPQAANSTVTSIEMVISFFIALFLSIFYLILIRLLYNVIVL